MDKLKIISKMTLRQKADMLTGKDFWTTQNYPDLGIRSMFFADGPHGLRKQAAASDRLGLNPSIPATCFPTASVTACSWDTELGEEIGKALGEEAAGMDVDVLLGPGLNIKRNPLCGRNFEYFSEDPLLAGKMAASYVRGIQSQNVAACLKHFAVNNREYRRMTSDSIIDERTFRELYLRGFEIAVKEGGSKCIMSSYNKINGTFANENKHLLVDILRSEWGFNGVVITDWCGSNSRINGLKCGNELEMPVCKYGADDIVKAVQEGEIDESLLDKSIDRLLALSDFCEKKKNKPFDEKSHQAVAKQAALRSAVLLKNDGILPLKKGTKVAVIGDFAFQPRYQGAGSSIVNPIHLAKSGEAFEKSGLNCVFAHGFNRFGKKSKKLYNAALKAAEQADVVLFFAGLDEFSEVEGMDRQNMKMPENQTRLCRALISAGKKVAVVLHCGSSIELNWTDGASALLWMGLSGQEGAEAEVDLITGKANPCGKLAETWWKKYEDCYTSDPNLFPGGEDKVPYREKLSVGYRYCVTNGVKPEYPFGFGLSYTKFEYRDLHITPDEITFTVKNIGEEAGREIVQIYYGLTDGAVKRPKRQLFAFRNIYLESRQEKKITVPYNGKDFAFYDLNTNSYITEEGQYTIEIGASSEDIKLSAKIHIDGVTLESEKDVNPNFFNFLELKKHRKMTVDENTTVGDLRYAKGWIGRFMSWAVRAAIRICKLFGNRSAVNSVTTGILELPVRGLGKYGGMNRRKFDGLLYMFNGHFFKGLNMLIIRKKEAKK